MQANLQIRQGTPADLPAVLSLYAQPGMDEGRTLPLEEAEVILARMASYPDYRLFVAELGGRIIGTFALLIMDNLAHLGEPSGVIEDVVVHGDWRGRGIGKAMMIFAMERCRERGCYKVVLSSNEKREAAHRFYESLGFRRHGYSFRTEQGNE